MQNEENLLRSAQQGDAQAFSTLYELYADRVHRYFAARVTAQEAEDLTADTFLKALEGLGRFRWQGAPFGAWLFRIAHNALIDHWRGAKRRTVEWLDDIGEEAHPTQADHALRAVTADELRRCLDQLTDLQQEAVSLRFIADLPIHEVASVMQRKAGAIKDLQHKALVALRKCLDP